MSTTYDPVSGTYVDDSSATVAGGADGGDSLWAGLGGLFSSLGTTVSQAYSSISGPTTVKPGTVIYDPRTGTTQTAGTLGNLTQGNGLILILAFGLLLAFILLRR